VQLEGLGQLKYPVTSSGIKPATGIIPAGKPVADHKKEEEVWS
jgi:hypothetical protein